METNSSLCIPEVKKTLTKSLPAIEYFYLSGKGYDDLGRYNECVEAKDSKYALIVADYMSIHIMLGICVPEECTTSEIKNTVISVIEFLDKQHLLDTGTVEVIYSKAYSEESLPVSSILVVIIGMIYTKIVLYGSYLYFKSSGKVEENSFANQILMEMSIQKNYSQFFQITPNKDSLQCFNGIRVLASCSIIMLHVLIFSYRNAFSDISLTLESSADFSHKFIFIFFYSVDIFFFMSGLLMSYLTLSEIQKNKEFSWGRFLLKRFIRYSPVYYFTITIGIFLLRYAGSGPQWPMAEKAYPGCKDYWWSCYLYLMNLIPFDRTECTIWVWQVCADFQFFLISPLIMIAYIRNKTAGYVFCLMLMLGSFLYIGIISNEYEYTPTFKLGWSEKDQHGMIYTKPFARITPFLLGVVIGWIYRNYKDTDKNREIETEPRADSYGELLEKLCIYLVNVQKLRQILYVFGLLLIIWVNFIVDHLDGHGQDYWTQSEKSAFLVFHRLIFTIGFSFWVFPMLMGHCNILKSFLCLPIFQVFARSSYSLYMIHPLILTYINFSRSQAIINDWFYLFVSSVSLLFIASIASIVVTIIVELPILSLERKYLRG